MDGVVGRLKSREFRTESCMQAGSGCLHPRFEALHFAVEDSASLSMAPEGCPNACRAKDAGCRFVSVT